MKWIMEKDREEWVRDSKKWRGRELFGEHSHWCCDWDFLPTDETCPEWPCSCASEITESE